MSAISPSSLNRKNLHRGGVFQLGDQLDQRFPQGRHHICRIQCCQSPDDRNRYFSISEDLVVHCDEQRSHILGLRKVPVELFVQ